MKIYSKYIIVLLLTIFSFYYTDKVIELSEYNNTILASINDYASLVDEKCNEGFISEDGITLGYSGIIVDKNKSYSNMKGIGFREDLIEYSKNECILNKENNYDKYIISGNKYKNNISLVIDIDSGKYYDEMNLISEKEKIKLNYLVDINSNINDNVLFKTNKNNIKEFKKKVNDFYCVKYNDFDAINYCQKEKINSIKIMNYIDKNLLFNVKKILDKGQIIFIKENSFNLNELYPSIKYIKSRGYNIVSINELLS